MVTLYEVTQSNATSTLLEIEHLVMQVASCASDWILIYSMNIYIRLLCDYVLELTVPFPPYEKIP